MKYSSEKSVKWLHVRSEGEYLDLATDRDSGPVESLAEKDSPLFSPETDAHQTSRHLSSVESFAAHTVR